MRRRIPTRAAESLKGRPHNLTVLIAVKPAPLARVIQHLLRHHDGIVVLGSVDEARRLVSSAVPLTPNVILANLSLLGREPGPFIAEIKRCSPGSRLVLTSQAGVLPSAARNWGADAFIAEEALVSGLIPLLGRLTLRPRSARRSA